MNEFIIVVQFLCYLIIVCVILNLFTKDIYIFLHLSEVPQF